MSGLRELRYAARDPFAGSVNLQDTTPYLSRKKITIVGPERADLEIVTMSMHVEFELAVGRPRTNVLIETWSHTIPRAIELGEELFRSGELRRLRDTAVPVATVVDALAARL